MVINLNLPKRRSVLMDVPLYKRFFSFLIDYLVVDFFIITYFMRPINELIPTNLGVEETMGFIKTNPLIFGKLSLLLGLMGVLIMSYFVYSQKVFTQTIGMRLMNLELINQDKKKKNIELWQIFVRNIFLIPIFPFLLLWIVDPIYLVIYNRKFSDVLTKLRLVEEKTL